ncbi:hypothetical protein [Leptospira paudalimensis]|uniref:DUF2029 domain-containing protein n=1 Tax=Leptospira paudalimensis TaxID=2950024 RepID=A0ABT3M5D2_9LEPT|nr:hypothetical protein [Leptospira paudalimensis]MCW7503237.1 hypothetical protein [Leptospira paudalimensis]
MLLFYIYPFLLFFVVNGFDRNSFLIVIISAVILSLYFFFLGKKLHVFKNQFILLFLYNVLLRCIVMGSTPHFSDDVYRYLFDAKILLNGQFPYEFTPSEWMNLHPNTNDDLNRLYSNMNSSHYYSVYPLFLLLFFMIGSVLNSFLHSMFLGVQIVFVLVDLVNLSLIRRFFPKESMEFYWAYFANPIILIEGISQMHPEILLVPWVLILLQTKSNWKQGIFLTLLTQLKFNTLLFVFGYLKEKRKKIYILVGILFSFIIWKLTVFANLESQGSKGIGLFFHSFRFAGLLEPFLYFILKQIGHAYLSGFISLSLCGLLFFCFIFNQNFRNFPVEKRLFVLYFCFMLMSPVIHPWYWILFILLGVVNRIHLLWQSLLVFLTFLSYLIYVSENYFYLYWALSFVVIGLYGIKEIDYFRKTTNPGTSENSFSKDTRR